MPIDEQDRASNPAPGILLASMQRRSRRLRSCATGVQAAAGKLLVQAPIANWTGRASLLPPLEAGCKSWIQSCHLMSVVHLPALRPAAGLIRAGAGL